MPILFLIVEVVLQLLGMTFWFVAGSVGHSISDRREANPFFAAIGLILMGAISGWVGSALLPNRLVPVLNIHGLSVLVSAVITGSLMMKYGQWREDNGGQPTYLATFQGGAMFAASMALTRWALVAH